MKRILIVFIIVSFLFVPENVLAGEKMVKVLLYKDPAYVEISGEIAVSIFKENFPLSSPFIYQEKEEKKDLRLRVGVFVNFKDALNYAASIREKIKSKKVIILKREGKFNVDIGSFSSLEELQAFKLLHKSIIPFSMKKEVSGLFISLDDGSLSFEIERKGLDGEFSCIKGNRGFVRVNGAKYRGEIDIIKHTFSIYFINKVSLEDYVKGVVPSEMPESFNIEALKAQAVASRTYVLSRMRSSNLYDVTSTPDTQAYLGMDRETEKTNKAVSETEGEVLMYGGKIITAVYHSTSGGFTENNENVWNSPPVPYLRGVESPYEERSPHFSWKKYVTNYRVQMVIKKYIEENNLPPIGEVLGFKILKKGVSPRVVLIEVIGRFGRLNLRGTTFSNLFGLKSTWFTFKFKRYKTPFVHSFLSVVERTPFFRGTMNKFVGFFAAYEEKTYRTEGIPPRRWDIVEFDGKGWGHGVGMSQWGAEGFAEKGWNYKDILFHFYQGTELVKLNED